MRHVKTDRGFDFWALLAWLVVAVVLVLVLTGGGLTPVPDHPTARERAAQFAAQERYYDVMERYGDLTAATQAARLVWEENLP